MRSFLLPIFESGGPEFGVVGLPTSGGKHMFSRGGAIPYTLRIRCFFLQAKGIQHLHLVPSLKIQSAVAPALPPCRRLVRQAELEVKKMILKELDALCSFHEEMILGHTARLEILGIRAFEKNDGPFGRLCSRVGLFRSTFLSTPDFCPVESLHLNDPRFENASMLVVLKNQAAVLLSASGRFPPLFGSNHLQVNRRRNHGP